MDAREKGQVYGLAVKLAADTYDSDVFDDDSEYIGAVLLRADVFYAEMVKHQAAMFGTPAPVATAQRAAQTAVAAATQGTVLPDPFEVPFGEEPPMQPVPPTVDSAALPDLQGTGLGMHDSTRWGPTDRRCPNCGMYTLVANLMDKGPRFECGSRARTKNPNSGEWETVSACNYTAWG